MATMTPGTLDQVRQVIVSELGAKPEEVTPEARLAEDLDMDSLDSVELCMAIEDEWGFWISDDEWAAAEGTVGDVVALVERKAAE